MGGSDCTAFACLHWAMAGACLGLLVSMAAHAQQPLSTTTIEAGTAEAVAEQDLPTEQQVRSRTRWVMGGASAVAAYGFSAWWKDGFSGKFRVANEGWFGQDTYTGGADKVGHAYFGYVGTRVLARGFEWAGNDARRSLDLAVATSMGTLLMVEVLDGFSRKFRFSKEDVVMNFVGAGGAMLLERHPELDRLFDFRLQYWPSDEARRLNQRDPIADHSGQTYLLVAKASGVAALRKHEGLRFLELALGYGTRGYEPHDAAMPADRSRHVYFGISLNLSEILAASVFRETPGSRAQKAVDGALEYLQVPGTAALADRRF